MPDDTACSRAAGSRARCAAPAAAAASRSSPSRRCSASRCTGSDDGPLAGGGRRAGEQANREVAPDSSGARLFPGAQRAQPLDDVEGADGEAERHPAPVLRHRSIIRRTRKMKAQRRKRASLHQRYIIRAHYALDSGLRPARQPVAQHHRRGVSDCAAARHARRARMARAYRRARRAAGRHRHVGVRLRHAGLERRWPRRPTAPPTGCSRSAGSSSTRCFSTT